MALMPEKMLRVRIIGSNMRKDHIITALHDAGVIQLETVEPDITKAMGQAKPGELYRKVNRYLQIYRGYENLLPHTPVKSTRAFGSMDELLGEASRIDLENELKVLKSRESDLLSEIKEINNRLEAVVSLMGLSYDLSIFNGSTISSYIARGFEDGEALSVIREKLPDATVFRLPNQSVVVTIPAKKDAELARVASELKFSISHIPEMSGRPEEYSEAMKERLAGKTQDLDEVRKDLMDISEQYFEPIAQIREQLEIENRKLEVSDKLASTQDSFALEGWVPQKHYQSMVSLVNDASENSVIIRTVESKEDPPTLLSNPKRFRVFEFFINFYSLPKEFEFDPTMIFGLIFPFFFGLMVGDWGYGLVILAGATWMKKKLTTPGARTILPKGLTNFAMTVFGRNALLVLARTLVPGAIVAMVVGLLFNSFFGFPLLPVTVFEVAPKFTASIMGFPPQPSIVLFHLNLVIPKLLLLTGYIGLAMVTFGLVLGLANEARRKHWKGVGGKIGWLLMAWGVAMFGLNLIQHSSNFSFSLATNPVAPISLGAFITGIVVMAVSEGTRGLIEIPSIISHILSYTRILGILLAAVYLSYVLDLIFLRGVSKSPVFAAIGILVLLLGQLFTIGIAILEPGIQGARLIYVEFFSKFYYGNGKIFRPFKTTRKYTTPKFSLETARK